MTSDRSPEFIEGALAGTQPEGSAVDCAYLPPDPRRIGWMEGFASTRPDSSLASDPVEIARPRGSDPIKSGGRRSNGAGLIGTSVEDGHRRLLIGCSKFA